MARPTYNIYNPSDWGDKELDLHNRFMLQMQDARQYFLNCIKPRLDRSYKLYVSYTGDRQREIKRWQANVFVPYTQAAVETLMPRILDARPDFVVRGRNEEDQAKAEKQKKMNDYLWEIAKMDDTAEDLTRASLIYGTGYLQVSWKKDVRTLQFLKTKDISKKKYEYEKRDQVFYDAPFCEWVDNYSLWYDWHNTKRESKQYWFKRLVLTEGEIRRRYPMADKKRLELALNSPGGDLNDYASIRTDVKTNNPFITKGDSVNYTSPYVGHSSDKYNTYGDQRLRMYETFEWTRPFDDAYSVIVGGSYVPILKGGEIPIPYDFKEASFIEVPYLRMPNEFEGYGLPMILENPQIMLNMIKNQRLDAATLSIHKMWIVNPMANINKEELVTRPFGIIYSPDPQGVREVQFSDIKASAYKEEDLLKSDMRYSSGVDDFSMGQGGGASSATEVRHLRESTLERVRLFVNHLGSAYSDVMRYWMSMQRQFMTKAMTIRIIGEDGKEMFPLIEKDDLMGQFDYQATVLPSIAGQIDVQKKQDMDLFQLLISLPFIDPKKLTSKVLSDWNWSLDTISKADDAQPEQPQMGPDGQPMQQGDQAVQEGTGAPMMPPGGPQPMPAPGGQMGLPAPQIIGKQITPAMAKAAIGMLRGPGDQSPSGFSQASAPINLMGGGQPPTVKGIGGPGVKGGKNTRGHNRTGKVNTDIPRAENSSAESLLLNRAFNIQR